jgi:tetratricopeptide (TPR) repeat protein
MNHTSKASVESTPSSPTLQLIVPQPGQPLPPATDTNDTESPEVEIITDHPLPPTTTAPPATPPRSAPPSIPPAPLAAASEKPTKPAPNRTVKSAILGAETDVPAEVSPLHREQGSPLLNDAAEMGILKIETAPKKAAPNAPRYPVTAASEPAPLPVATNHVQPIAPGAPPVGDEPNENHEPANSLRARSNAPDSSVEQTSLEQSPPDERPTGSTIRITSGAEPAPDSEPDFISDYSDSPSGWLVEAQELARTAQTTEQLAAVTRLCNRVISANPQDKLAPFSHKLAAWAHNRSGELLVDANQHAVALAEFQAAVDHDPQNSLAIHNRAVTLAQQNEFDAALIDFNRVIELNPGLAVAYRNRAELLAAQGKSDDAIADYTHAIQSMPDDAELYRARAHAFQQIEQFEPALNDLDQSIRIAPNVIQNYTQRGNLMADRGDFVHALDDFNHALSIDKTSADAHRGIAWIKATCPDDRLRDAFEALSAARAAVQAAPSNDYLALDVLAAAHANAGEFDKAIDAQLRAMQAAPAEAVTPMRARLELYENRKPYRAGR